MITMIMKMNCDNNYRNDENRIIHSMSISKTIIRMGIEMKMQRMRKIAKNSNRQNSKRGSQSRVANHPILQFVNKYLLVLQSIFHNQF